MADHAHQIQTDILASLSAFPALAQQDETDAQRVERVSAAEALDETNTAIAEGTLASNTTAINALAAKLNASATDLNNIRQRVVAITNFMNQLKSAADALGRLVAQLPKPAGASQAGGKPKT